MDDVYSPEARAIYQFPNGSGKMLRADPLALLSRLKQHALPYGKTVDQLIDISRKVDATNASSPEIAEAWSALEALADIARKAFPLVEFNEETGEGAEMAFALGVLDHFHVWCEKKNQTQEPPATCMQPTESISETQPTMAM